MSPMSFVDLAPAARRMTGLITSVPDDLLSAPTPCQSYAVGDLLDHVGGLALAFTAAAAKASGSAQSQSPLGSAARLAGDWRTRIPRDLDALTRAWRDPAARTGVTRAGGVDLPREVAAVVALEELVIHGWDLARASGQPYGCDEQELEVVRGFIAQFAGPGQEELRGEAYGGAIQGSE